MARLIMVLEFRDPRTAGAHHVAGGVVQGHYPGVKLVQARWADDVETVEELVRDEEDE